MAGLSFTAPAAGKRGYVFGNADPKRGRGGDPALNVSFSDFDPGDLVALPVTVELTSPSFGCAELSAPNVSVSLVIDADPACAPPASRLGAAYSPATCKVTITAVGGGANATHPELSALMPCLIFAFGASSALASDEVFRVTIAAADVVANRNSGPAWAAYGSIAVAFNVSVTLSSAANSSSAAAVST